MSIKEKSLSDPGNYKGSNPMLLAAPVLAILISWSFHHFGEMETEAVITLGIAIWTALWWIFEAVPIPIASLLPLSLLPLFGVLSPKVVGEKYGHYFNDVTHGSRRYTGKS